MQGHQQFPPFALQGFPLANLVGIKGARQLLGQGAAPFQHATPHQIGEQGPGGAHWIDPWMPPEAAVLARQQGIDQDRRVMAQAIGFVVPQGIHRGDGFARLVVEHQGPPHAGQAAPDGGLGHRDPKHHQATGGQGGQAKAG